MEWNKALAWIFGACFALIVAWGMGAVFANGFMPKVFDPLIREYVVKPGTIVRWRSEGWADTHFGEHGFVVGDDRIAQSDKPKFVLWGDSHAEALQVPDNRKISAVYNRLSGGSPYSCVTVGRSGHGVVDYYFAIPIFEKAFPGILGHVFLLSGLEDVMPSSGMKNGYGVFQRDPWKLSPGDGKPSSAWLRYGAQLESLRVRPFYELASSILQHDFRFLPGEFAPPSSARESASLSLNQEKAWGFLLSSLRQRTSGFLVFVYCPEDAPRPSGQGVLLAPLDSESVGRFRSVCREFGIYFVDMSPAFNGLYTDTGRLPRGFFNSFPGQGHLNADGLRLIAEALHDWDGVGLQ